MASQVKSIRALARGLDVLHLLQSTGGLTLHELHLKTAIPKASLLRILKTLMEAGSVWQRMVDDAYVPSYSLSEMARRMDQEHGLVEIASPILKELSDEIKWPSVLAVPRISHMEVIETNVSRSYFDDIPLGPKGFQINMLRSATGRAFIASCEAPVREVILDHLRRSDRPGDFLARSQDYIARLLADVAKNGYALRDYDFGGDFDVGRGAVDDGRESLGVAIRAGDHVPGAINITWAKRAFDREKGANTLASRVIAAADAIGAALARKH